MVNRLDRCDATKYIRNFWNATRDFTREKALYRAITNRVKTPRDAKNLLQDLDALAESYHYMVYPSEMICQPEDPAYKVKLSLSSLRMLNAKTFYPIILAMKKQGSYNDADLFKVVKIIECYVFRNSTICRKTANSMERYFSDIAQKIYGEDLNTVEDICVEIRKGIVSDDEFKESFKIWTGSSSYKDTIRYILRNIHQYLCKSNELLPNNNNMEVHIEHIMPEDNSEWKVDDEIHDTYLWRLGNLCLLSGPKNQSISNKPFSEKRGVYLESQIEPNKSIAENTIWNDETIEKRQELFATYALEIWKK